MYLRNVTRAFMLVLVLAGGLAACAETGSLDIGSVTHRDGKVTDYTGITYAPKNTDVQIRVEGRTYEKDGAAWKQVGETTTTVTSGEHEGSKWGRAALGAGSVLGGAAILKGADAPSAAATAKQGQSAAGGTGANAGNVTVQ